MKFKLLFYTFAVCTLPTVPAVAQSSNWHGMMAGPAQAAELEPGRTIRFETWDEKLGKSYVVSVFAQFDGVERKEGKTAIRRIIRDNFNQIEVGYSVTLEATSGGRAYRATFDGLHQADPPKKGWTVLAPCGLPAPQTIQIGEILGLTLYRSPNGPKMVEFIRIGAPDRQPLQDEPARDSYAVGAELTITRPKLKVNGQPVAMVGSPADLHGPLVRVRVPGFGAYVLSLEPHPEQGFEEAGEVSGAELTFQNHGNVFRIECGDRIASGSAKYNLYARMDSSDSAASQPGGATVSVQPTP